jgi:hypothetical protein
MPSNLNTSLVAAQAQAVAMAPLPNNGFMDVYPGTQPATPETAPGVTALATFALPATFAASTVNGVITANVITPVTIANTGTAVWFRVWESDHTTPLFDGLVGTSGSDMNLNAVSLVACASLSVSSFTYTVPGV